jgi:carboxyl-terminal processing protease
VEPVDQYNPPNPEYLRPPRSSLRAPVLVLVAVLVFGGVFLLGTGFGASGMFRDVLRSVLPGSVASSVLGSRDLFPLQREVLEKVEQLYYKDFDPASLEDSAVKGMVAGLNDPWSDYLNPTEYASLNERIEGKYTGVGMVVEMNGKFVQVVSAFKGSPAESGGVKPGDIVLGVDDVPTDGLSLEQVVAKIRGLEGTTVTLQIYHLPAGSATGDAAGTQGLTDLPTGGASAEVTLDRKAIDVPVVETEIKTTGTKKAAHITLSMFSDGSADKLREAVTMALEQDKVDAIVLDLRNNGGGLLGEAVGVASIFIPSGVVVSEEGLHSPKQVFEVSGSAIPNVPVYVLVNAFSASASEIVAAALKDHQRATLVGETTFGKGLVQNVLGLSNGGALKVTIAVYLTPNGTDINKKGIIPDVEVKTDATTVGDPVLDKALELVLQGT